MALLVAWLSLLSIVSLLNLLFTFGVIRRLREHTVLLSSRQTGRGDQVMLGSGERVGDFAVTAAGGDEISRATLFGLTLVAFFSPHCPACQERLPTFLTRAAGMPGGRAQVIAVVVGSGEDTVALKTQLAGVAQIVVQPDRSPMVRAFGVQGYPAFALVESDGTVVDSGFDMDELQVPVAS